MDLTAEIVITKLRRIDLDTLTPADALPHLPLDLPTSRSFSAPMSMTSTTTSFGLHLRKSQDDERPSVAGTPSAVAFGLRLRTVRERHRLELHELSR